nr:VOC family protein [Gammaproteobacteria bacterium]
MSNSLICDADRPVAFITVSDRARAKDFYVRKLGLKVVHEDDFSLVVDLGITSLRISELNAFQPQPSTVLGWEVADIVSAANKMASLNIAAKRYDGLEQDKLGIWSPPGTSAKVLWFE